MSINNLMFCISDVEYNYLVAAQIKYVSVL